LSHIQSLTANLGGQCRFCGCFAALTKGHVWPKWLDQLLPRTATHHEQETGRFSTFEPSVPGPDYELKIRQGHARSRKPRNTCARCNNGWMSGIEGFAKFFMRPLILGYAPVLSPIAQFSISALLCLIATRLEFLGEMRAIRVEDRDWLRYYREPNEHWRVWIAWFGGDDRDEHWARTYAVQHTLTPTEEVGAAYCDTRISTLVIGHVCAHIFYCHDSELVSKMAYDGIRLTQIWPARGYDLPTAEMSVLDGKALLWLHEAYAREAPTLPRAC
jgi:hypothetical protein